MGWFSNMFPLVASTVSAVASTATKVVSKVASAANTVSKVAKVVVGPLGAAVPIAVVIGGLYGVPCDTMLNLVTAAGKIYLAAVGTVGATTVALPIVAEVTRHVANVTRDRPVLGTVTNVVANGFGAASKALPFVAGKVANFVKDVPGVNKIVTQKYAANLYGLTSGVREATNAFLNVGEESISKDFAKLAGSAAKQTPSGIGYMCALAANAAYLEPDARPMHLEAYGDANLKMSASASCECAAKMNSMIRDYSNEADKRTFVCLGGFKDRRVLFIAFRGTDFTGPSMFEDVLISDVDIVNGTQSSRRWAEAKELTQKLVKFYREHCAKQNLKGTVFLTGHSLGGTIAHYAIKECLECLLPSVNVEAHIFNAGSGPDGPDNSFVSTEPAVRDRVTLHRIYDDAVSAGYEARPDTVHKIHRYNRSEPGSSHLMKNFITTADQEKYFSEGAQDQTKKEHAATEAAKKSKAAADKAQKVAAEAAEAAKKVAAEKARNQGPVRGIFRAALGGYIGGGLVGVGVVVGAGSVMVVPVVVGGVVVGASVAAGVAVEVASSIRSL